MTRPLRLEHPSALWHVHNRGVERRSTFLDDRDRTQFLELLACAAERYRWRIHTFTLMTNHFHLLIQTMEPTLSRGMQKLEGDYARGFNRRLGRVGPLFQGRFRAHLVDSGHYLLELARYIVLNPVRAGMVESPGDWPWSSYRGLAGLVEAPPWLWRRTILEQFHPTDRSAASHGYRQFVIRGIGSNASPWENLTSQLYLGGKEFIARVEELVKGREWNVSDARNQQYVSSVELNDVRHAVEAQLRVPLAPKERGTTAGFSVAVLKGDDLILETSYGMADLETPVASHRKSMYRIGSLGKAITAAAVMRLVEEGYVDLEAPVGDYLAYPDRDVRVRHLLTHTSGIPNYSMDPALDYYSDELDHATLLERFSGSELRFEPGTAYHYSNSNYYLLGMLIEEITGRKYHEYTEAEITGIAGRAELRYCPSRPIIPNRAHGYRLQEGAFINARPVGIGWAFSAGGQCSTAGAYARWLRALFSGRVVSPRSVALMTTRPTLADGDESGYGFGLAIEQFRGQPRFTHAGNLDGFQSAAAYYPDSELTIVVLSNTESSGATRLASSIAERLLGTSADEVSAEELPISPEQLRAYIGRYSFAAAGGLVLSIVDRDGTLSMVPPGGSPSRLRSQGEGSFVVVSDPDTKLQFRLDSDGRTALELTTVSGTFTGRRVAPEPDPAAAEPRGQR